MKKKNSQEVNEQASELKFQKGQEFPGSTVAKTPSVLRAQVQSPVRKLRSHKLCGSQERKREREISQRKKHEQTITLKGRTSQV